MGKNKRNSNKYGNIKTEQTRERNKEGETGSRKEKKRR